MVEDKLSFCIEQNVNARMTHLRTIPSVAARLSSGSYRSKGGETGSVYVYSSDAEKFTAFKQAYPEPLLVH
jgi:hypothetical protein